MTRFWPVLLPAITLFSSFSQVHAIPQELSTITSSFLSAATASVASDASSVLSAAGIVDPVDAADLAAPPETVVPIATTLTASSTSFGGAAATDYGVAFIPKGQNLKAALSQAETNGNSLLGTPEAPKVASKALAGPLLNGSPWGNARADNVNYYSTVPHTGETRTYDFRISRQTIAPDGVKKSGLVINGGFPGPKIEANWGDQILVNVHNDLDDEGTALHWHGILQKNSIQMDGVPAVQQCPIAPGKSFTYSFQADLYGTSWYHSHYSAQYAGGLFGPMVIHGPVPDSISYDEDKGPIMLTDWNHDEYFELVEQTMTPGKPPVTSNNTLINGKMNYPCDNGKTATGRECTPNAGLATFSFETGKTYRLRLINPSSEAIMKFSIDQHEMTVFANDFVEVKPYKTKVVTLGVGQRSDVIVKATGKKTDTVWMRANISTACSLVDGVSPFALAVIQYQNADKLAIPKSKPSYTDADIARCGNDDLSLTTPYLPLKLPSKPATTEELWINAGPNATKHFLWTINGQTFRADYNDPVLLEAKLGRTRFPAEWAVHNYGSNSSVRLVVYNNISAPHPMHIHGHNMYVLSEGIGKWDGSIKHSANPQRRDVQIIQAAAQNGVGKAPTPAHMVIQFDQDNPGVWPFHCHIAWHVSAGLYMNILERPADITSRSIPMTLAQTCRDWSAWTGSHIPNQIDSGL